MQSQRALTVGKLLLGRNLVNLCPILIPPYLTQPYTVSRARSLSLWPACKSLARSEAMC